MANTRNLLDLSLLSTTTLVPVLHEANGDLPVYIGDGNSFDTVSYAGYTALTFFRASLPENSVGNPGVDGDGTGWAQNASYESIEGLIGIVNGTNRLGGNSADNKLTGGNLNDTLSGGGGADTLVGGAGIDRASYEHATEGVTVYLGGDGTNTGEAVGDQFDSIEGLIGSNFDDYLVGNSADNTLEGGTGNDTFIGGAGADSIVGGDGIDTLSYANATTGFAVAIGGAGLNRYNAEGLQGAAQGDRISMVEVVIGSNFNDTVIGSNGDNTIDGGAGNDFFDGHGGVDRFVGGEGSDTVSYMYASAVNVTLKNGNEEGTGVETFSDQSTETDILVSIENLIGSTSGDILTGNDSANILNGYSGADNMTGGLGHDIYYIDNAGDAVTETDASAQGGNDLVYTAINYALGANVENLTALAGQNALNLTGNALNNVITGNEKNNVIIGGLGADTMAGGAGDDTYYVDDLGDLVVDTSGNNVVYTSVSFNRAQFAGQIIATGTNAIDLNGDASANVLTGNAGSNRINGGAGNDVLTGGAGQDTFVFDTAIGTYRTNRAVNFDTIADFAVGQDKILLENAIFTKLKKVGPLSKANFVSNTKGKAADSKDYIVYNKKTGILSYDADGSGKGKAVEIMKFDNKPNLSWKDFLVI